VDRQDWDCIVIGAGAAGLLAAYRACSRGLKTLLVEKNRQIGVKILISGGTRCNITHDTDARTIASAFGRQGDFLQSALAAFGPDELVRLVNDLGVPTKVEPTGKIFPVSDRAVDVRDALVRLVRQAGCAVLTEAAVTNVTWQADRFRVSLPDRHFTGQHVIVTTGGKSYPGCGTCGDGYLWAQQFGHTIVDPVPSLAPLVVGDQWPRELRGITIDDVKLTVMRGEKERLEQSRESLLFTHFGLSGPAPMNVSRAFGRVSPAELKLHCDFWPADDFDRLRKIVLSDRDRYPARSISSVFRPVLSRRLVVEILRLAGIDPKQRCSEVSYRNLDQAIRLLKTLPLSVQGTRGFNKAEVTAGGVELVEVDSSTMQSKRRRGLYFAGEILDVDGPIGGYNFQAAFSTGWLAGSRVGIR
jgi:hypothetical protein